MSRVQASEQPSLEMEECRDLFLELTEEEWQLLAEAGVRCDLSTADYVLRSALAAARDIVPLACQPPDVETTMSGLFEERESDES